MKKYIIQIATIIIGFTLLISCNDSFMERYPKSELSPQTYFRNEKEVRSYTNGFYLALPTGNRLFYDAPYYADDDARNLVVDEIRGSRIVPNTGGRWTWEDLRSINYYLQYSDQCESEKVRIKYDALAHFFRAYFYLEKIQNFGDVPWYDYVLDLDDEGLYKARDSRQFVFERMLADIDDAIENLDSERKLYEVTKWTALALKSRMCLYEGTFRKHHGIDGWRPILEECAKASHTLMTESGYKLYTSTASKAYQELFTLENANANEIILARQYKTGLLDHQINVYTLTAAWGRPGVTRSVVNSYLMQDGTRFTDKPDYEQKQFKEECEGRDPRLAQTIRTPGYSRIGESAVSLPDFSASLTGYQYIKFVMGSQFDGGKATNDMPIFRLAEVYLNYAEAKAELGTIEQGDIDISIKHLRDRVGMPNLDVEKANANPDPYLANQYEYVDQGSYKGVILEVRRERRIELIREGFRWHDLMRWKAGKLLEQRFHGMYFPGVGTYDLDGNGTIDLEIYSGEKPNVTGRQLLKLGADIVFDNNANSGQMWVNSNIDKRWREDRDYFYPIPTQERTLNPKLTQNPNWLDDLQN